MAIFTVNTDQKYDAFLLEMTREMIGEIVEGEEGEETTRQATAQEAVEFWENRFRKSIAFFGKKHFEEKQILELEDAPDITVTTV